MALAAVLVITLVAAALIMFTRPWRLSIALRAEGRPDGSWAIAGGVQGMRCSASVAAARGVEPVVDLRVLGRRVWSGRGGADVSANAAPRRSDERGKRRWLAAYRDRGRRLGRWFDPISLAAFLLGESRRFAIRDLEGSVRFGLHDVALAGQISGALSALSALSAPFGRFDHEVDWSMNEHLDANLSLTIHFTPARLAWDFIRFAARSIKILPSPRPRAALLSRDPAPQG
jgi:hypothetical protein